MALDQITATDGPANSRDDTRSNSRSFVKGSVLSSATVRDPSTIRPRPTDGADEPSTVGDEADGSIYRTPDRGASAVRRSALPAARTTGAAILIAARRTGSAVVWTATRSGRQARHFRHGTQHSIKRTFHYVSATDQRATLGGIKNATDLALFRELRRERWYTAGGTAAGAAIATWIGWDYLGWLGPAAEVGILTASLAAYGRNLLKLPAPGATPAGSSAAAAAPGQAADLGEPFPLSSCTGPEQAVDCLARALRVQNLKTRELRVIKQYSWGWEFDVLLKGSTPAELSSVLDKLEGHMDLPHGGFLPEPDSQNRSHLTARLVVSDPFALMPAPVIHAPRSLSIHDLIIMGQGMDGSPLELSLDGFYGAVIGAMGAGKTLGALRTLAEAITACVDAVAWDLDPVKGGLAEFGDLMAVRARGEEECMARLEQAMAYVTARGEIFQQVGMKDRWHATETHPALFIFIDEYIYLSKDAKQLAIKVLRLGRQYGIYIILAGQEMTEDALGDAIGAILAYKIMMSCRPEDTRIAFGAGRMAEGWLPHRLNPAVGKILNDAGKSFIMGGAFNRPIQYRFWGYHPDQIDSAIPDRLAAGMPSLDADTRRAAGEAVTTDGRDLTLADQVDALATEHGITDGRIIAALLRLYDAKGVTFIASSTLLEYLDDDAITWAGQPVDGDRLSRIIRAHAPGATVDRPTIDGRQVRGWHQYQVARAAEGLIDPSKARQQAS